MNIYTFRYINQSTGQIIHSGYFATSYARALRSAKKCYLISKGYLFGGLAGKEELCP